jgi:hypothetical protein
MPYNQDYHATGVAHNAPTFLTAFVAILPKEIAWIVPHKLSILE